MSKKRKELRSKVYSKTSGHCGYCGEWQDPFSSWHLEHMLPESKGGENSIENLILACPSCNTSKNNKTVEEFREYIPFKVIREARCTLEALCTCYFLLPPETFDRLASYILDALDRLHLDYVKHTRVTFHLDLIGIITPDPYVSDDTPTFSIENRLTKPLLDSLQALEDNGKFFTNNDFSRIESRLQNLCAIIKTELAEKQEGADGLKVLD